MSGASRRISLILGGARSGKSRFAEKLAARRAGEQGVLYVATLQPFDDEMRERVVSHRASRPATWQTVEAPLKLANGLLPAIQNQQLALIDCLTVWTGNLILRESGLEHSISDGINEEEVQILSPQSSVLSPDYIRLEAEIISELESIITEARRREFGLIMVSNEVGMGLVPPYPLGRAYRDLLGRVNQRLAYLADEAFFVLAGIPVDLKRLQAEFE
jgi:adenosylcobinamide kinase/adenosylcobinamide-phosphate guanylyltransferase